MVLVTGLEPVRYCYRGILSPLRLPVPPHQPNENYYSIGKMKKQLFFLENLTVERVILKAEEIKTIFLLYFFNLNKGRGLKNGKILIFDI